MLINLPRPLQRRDVPGGMSEGEVRVVTIDSIKCDAPVGPPLLGRGRGEVITFAPGRR